MEEAATGVDADLSLGEYEVADGGAACGVGDGGSSGSGGDEHVDMCDLPGDVGKRCARVELVERQVGEKEVRGVSVD